MTIISGNLGRDPELRYAQSGTAVLKLSVAVSDRVKRGDEWAEETTWYDAAVFGKRAEGLNKFGLVKGDRVIVRGRVKLRQYEKRDGTAGASLEIMADDVEPIRAGRREDSGQRQQGGGYGGQRQQQAQGAFPDDDYGGGFPDDDIPFMAYDERLA